jgi:hypothetical protein
MRCESVDMTEFIRRVNEGIYDKEEFKKALAWTNKNCKEGPDFNSPESRRSAEDKKKVMEYSIKMTMIARDLMQGNPRLAELGFGEEAVGHNAIAAGFGTAHVDETHCQRRFMKTILKLSLRTGTNREALVLARKRRNDGGQCFSESSHMHRKGSRRPHILDPKRGEESNPTQTRSHRPYPPHQLGATTMDATDARRKRKPAMNLLEITKPNRRVREPSCMCAAITNLQGLRFSSRSFPKPEAIP